MTWEPIGEDALLVRVRDTAQALALAGAARQAGLVREVVPAARTVLLDGLEGGPSGGGSGQGRQVVEEWLRDWRPTEEVPAAPAVTLDVRYDGPDLGRVAQLCGLSVPEVIARHTATTFRADFTGFAPGFAYLSGWQLPLPRLERPRAVVPAGSVALADRWCGVYPRASPGGWHLIGTTDAVLFDADAESPVLLAPGTSVRFREVP